jgi:hypothetical protein
MKRCPTCNRTYTDDAQRFCLDDGATLLEETAAPFDPQATIAMTGAQSTAPTSAPTSNPYGSGAGQSQPTPSWTPPSTQPSFTPPAPKRNIWPWLLGGAAVLIVGVVGLIIVIALLASSGSNSNSNNSNSRANTNSNSNSNKSNTNTSAPGIVLNSTDGHSQITVPSDWKTSTELNAKASIQAADEKNDMYVVVMTDDKANYSSMSLEDHSSQTLGALTRATTDVNKEGPTSLTINGDPALQYEVSGVSSNVKVVYLHTTVETDEHFQQIIVWTTQTQYNKRKDLLQNIIQSFKETGQ